MSLVGKKKSWLYLKIGILYDLLLYEAKAYATCENRVIFLIL